MYWYTSGFNRVERGKTCEVRATSVKWGMGPTAWKSFRHVLLSRVAQGQTRSHNQTEECRDLVNF